MKIEFSQHALDQLEIRTKITKSMVLDGLHAPDEVVDSYRDRHIFRKQYGTEWLEIVTVKEDNKLIIITQYILERYS
ncbi:MAG TPA: DUF4258 domain-containing protein [Candidatus Saccharimonadales bacterium]